MHTSWPCPILPIHFYKAYNPQGQTWIQCIPFSVFTNMALQAKSPFLAFGTAHTFSWHTGGEWLRLACWDSWNLVVYSSKSSRISKIDRPRTQKPEGSSIRSTQYLHHKGYLRVSNSYREQTVARDQSSLKYCWQDVTDQSGLLLMYTPIGNRVLHSPLPLKPVPSTSEKGCNDTHDTTLAAELSLHPGLTNLHNYFKHPLKTYISVFLQCRTLMYIPLIGKYPPSQSLTILSVVSSNAHTTQRQTEVSRKKHRWNAVLSAEENRMGPCHSNLGLTAGKHCKGEARIPAAIQLCWEKMSKLPHFLHHLQN